MQPLSTPSSTDAVSVTHINLEQFEEMRALLEEDFQALVETYMQDCALRLQEMQQAFDEQDERLGYVAAHSLKGASSNLGATHLAQLCFTLQEICRSNQLHRHQALIDDIRAECATVNAQIIQLLG